MTESELLLAAAELLEEAGPEVAGGMERRPRPHRL